MCDECRSRRRISWAAITLAATIMLQLLVSIYFYGRLSERVDRTQTDVQILLQMHLQKTTQEKTQ